MIINFVRHGQCDANKNGVYNRQDEDLNETGIKQAEELKKAIENIDYDVIISSPLLRAKHTAKIINVKDKEILFDDRIREREHHGLEGKPLELTNREDYWNYYSTTDYGGEERIPDLFERVKEFIDELMQKDYKSVLIVSHNGVAKAFYAYFNGVPEDGNFLNLGLKNTEVKQYRL